MMFLFFNCTLVSVDNDRRETLYLDLSSRSCLVYTHTIVIFEFSVSIHVFLSLFGIYTIVWLLLHRSRSTCLLGLVALWHDFGLFNTFTALLATLSQTMQC